jgi:hypothetical protein
MYPVTINQAKSEKNTPQNKLFFIRYALTILIAKNDKKTGTISIHPGDSIT